jgi:hypothetical protein
LPCPTDVPCREPSRIYCDCKRISKVVNCSGGTGSVGVRALQCTPQCEIETRNARFRDALQLDDTAARIPYPSELLEQVIAHDLFEFALRMERALADFLSTPLSHGGRPSHTFPPMQTSQRWLLHQLSSYWSLTSESFDPEPRRSVRVLRSAHSKAPSMKLTDAVKLYREAKNNKSGVSSLSGLALPRVMQPTAVLHLYDLALEPKISPADLSLALRPYAADGALAATAAAAGGPFRINFLDHSHALVVFPDANQAATVRSNLIARKLFAAEPDESASRAAVEAWRNTHATANNALFRRHHETGGVPSVKKLALHGAAAAAASPSSFDDWSHSRAAAAASASASSKGSDAPASSSSSSSVPSSWDSDEAEFQTQVEAAKRAPLPVQAVAPSLSSSSSSALSSLPSSVGAVSLSKPLKVSTSNAWSALGGEEAAAATASADGEGGHEEESASDAQASASEDDAEGGWERAAPARPRRMGKQATAEGSVPAPSRDAFDD